MVLLSYRTAAELTKWTIQKQPKGKWRLTATMGRADRFLLRQTPLRFTAPREKGLWCWPVVQMQIVEPNQLRATLGQPEQ